jgi:peptide-methionine (S)-S-oxide reductase
MRLNMLNQESLEATTMPRWMSAIAAGAMLAVMAVGGGAGTAATAEEAKTAIFAGGCFWCVEDAFDAVPGVIETISGYAGGAKPNPTYGDHEGYQEAVKVTYDPAKVTYAKLLDTYWHNIDPFDANGQFCDQGNAYRSAIFYGNDEEKSLADSTKQEIADRFKQTVATEIKPTTTFTAAEDYHQNYHTANPVSYKFYKWNCGRAQRLEQIWAPKPS